MSKPVDRKAAFDLIPHEDFAALVRDLVRRTGEDKGEATRLMDQAIAFVATAADIWHGGRYGDLQHKLVPTKRIEAAWLVLIQHTVFMRALAGSLGVFVDRIPYPEALQSDVEVTMAAIDAANYALHPTVWDTDDPAEARAGILGV
ncbi:hypothetical protein [Amycolatopsis sp. NPDC021455]|uniref:hypothetical protein n=1 Tax=Amycolatopsis sp. NPDC021455 TaxID=3154901 RepID=UPI0033C3B2B6